MTPSAPGTADQQCLAARFVEGPYVAVPDVAEQRLADWLAELAPEQSAALRALLAAPLAKRVLLGIAAFSPYLFDLVRGDAARLIRLLRCDPDRHLTALLETAAIEVFAASGEAEGRRSTAAPEAYEGAKLVDAAGAVIGEVRRIDGDRALVAVGGLHRWWGFWPVGDPQLAWVRVDALVLGPAPIVGKSYAMLADARFTAAGSSPPKA